MQTAILTAGILACVVVTVVLVKRKDVAMIRDMRPSDMGQVLKIESLCFSAPWDRDSFHDVARCRNSYLEVFTHRREVCGFVGYELFPDCIHLLTLAVHPAWQRRGIATSLVRVVTDNLTPDKYREATVCTADNNLTAQLFFRSQGFRCVEILPSYYLECVEPVDAYLFRVVVGEKSCRSRITQYLEAD